MLSLLSILLLTGCSVNEPKDKQNGCAFDSVDDCEAQVDDVMSYQDFMASDNVFNELLMSDILLKIENKETFVVYFGFEQCPWCVEAIFVLDEVAKNNDSEVAYVNTRVDDIDLRNEDNSDYVQLEQYFKDYTAEDNRIYVPYVAFIKEGEIVGVNEGTVDSHDAKQRVMTNEESEQLNSIYNELFESIK